MGIYGYYLRVTPEELHRVLADDGWARQFVNERLSATTGMDDQPDERLCVVDKAWNGIFYVLAEAGLPQNLIDGRVLITPVGGEPPTPRYLDPDEVAVVAQRLAPQPFAALVEAADPGNARAADLYSVGAWDDDDRAFVTSHGEDLPSFFATAASAGDAVVIHISF